MQPARSVLEERSMYLPIELLQVEWRSVSGKRTQAGVRLGVDVVVLAVVAGRSLARGCAQFTNVTVAPSCRSGEPGCRSSA